MAIKQLPVVAAPSWQHIPAPSDTDTILESQDFRRAVDYVKTLGRIKKMLLTLVQALPKKSRGTFVQALQHELVNNDFDFPNLDIQVSSVLSSVSSDLLDVMPLADRYLALRRTLSREFSSLSAAQKQTITQRASALDHTVIEQPIPGIDKHDPNNQKFVDNLVVIKETDPLLYKKLMSWD